MGLAGSAGVEFYANTAKFQEGVQKAAKEVGTFKSRLEDLQKHSGKLQNALFNLAGAAVGIEGPIGKIAESLSVFTLGGGVATGVAAGLALMGNAYRKLAEDIEEAGKQAAEAQRRFTSGMFAARQAADPVGFARENLQAAKAELKRLKDELNLMDPNSPFYGEKENQMYQVAADVKTLQRELKTAAIKTAREGSQAIMEDALDKIERIKRAGIAAAKAIKDRRSYNQSFLLPEGAYATGGADDSVPQINRGMTGASGPNELGNSPLRESWLAKAKAQAMEWKEAWVQAVRNIQDAVADLFVRMFTDAKNLLSVVKDLLLSLARIAANLLASQLITTVAGAVGSKAGVHLNGATGPGVNLTVNNAFALSAIEPAGMEAAIGAAYPAVTAAVVRGMQESAAVSRFMRGF